MERHPSRLPRREPGVADSDEQTPKILIDSDWKSEAQAEKERLAEQEAASQSSGGEGGGEGELPPADFRGLMGMLASQAVMYMGGMQDKEGRAVFDPYYAQHMIDLLGVLEEKTKGNLTDEEAGEISAVNRELRSQFVKLMQMVAQQQAGGGGGGAGGGAAPGAGPAGPMGGPMGGGMGGPGGVVGG
jgi:hypothetical protein